MSRDELISAFQAGDMGEIEFFELALEVGMDLDEIENELQDARGEW